jgi:formyl-CoA transferase
VQGAEGDWFILGVASDNVWRSFCKFVGRDDLAEMPEFKTNASRIANYDRLLPLVRAVICQRPTDEWLAELRTVGVPCGRINTLAQALGDPHLVERGMIVELEHPALGLLKSLATPIQLSASPLVYHRHPPGLGEHTDEVLAPLGYNDAERLALREQNIIQ